jgi:hypothetical protein
LVLEQQCDIGHSLKSLVITKERECDMYASHFLLVSLSITHAYAIVA